MALTGPSPACRTSSRLPNQPRDDSTSWPASPPVAAPRFEAKSGSSSATARTGR